MRVEETTLTPDQREWLKRFTQLRAVPFMNHRVRVFEGARVALLVTSDDATGTP